MLGNCSTTCLLFDLEGSLKLRGIGKTNISQIVAIDLKKDRKALLNKKKTTLKLNTDFYNEDEDYDFEDEEIEVTTIARVEFMEVKNMTQQLKSPPSSSTSNSSKVYCVRLFRNDGKNERERDRDTDHNSTIKDTVKMSKIRGNEGFEFVVSSGPEYLGYFCKNKGKKGEKNHKKSKKKNKKSKKKKEELDSSMIATASLIMPGEG